MPHLRITEDESAPTNTAELRDGKLVVSPQMMAEIREFMQQDHEQLVEAVARAIATANKQNGSPPFEQQVENKHSRSWLYDQARAAVDAVQSFVPQVK